MFPVAFYYPMFITWKIYAEVTNARQQPKIATASTFSIDIFSLMHNLQKQLKILQLFSA